LRLERRACAIASDPNYPKIVSVFAAPHKWFGLNVPGSRTSRSIAEFAMAGATVDCCGYTTFRFAETRETRQPGGRTSGNDKVRHTRRA
jgi:hypothetical protein